MSSAFIVTFPLCCHSSTRFISNEVIRSLNNSIFDEEKNSIFLLPDANTYEHHIDHHSDDILWKYFENEIEIFTHKRRKNNSLSLIQGLAATFYVRMSVMSWKFQLEITVNTWLIWWKRNNNLHIAKPHKMILNSDCFESLIRWFDSIALKCFCFLCGCCCALISSTASQYSPVWGSCFCVSLSINGVYVIKLSSVQLRVIT